MSEPLEKDIAAMKYIVRRLTPTECERLQGLPDGYTTVHFTEEMLTDELLDEFVQVKANWDAITAKDAAKVKPKTRKQVKDWLLKISENPPDAPRYKGCGNGWACNQPRWILMNILNVYYTGWDDAPCEGFVSGISPVAGATVHPCYDNLGIGLRASPGGEGGGTDATAYRVGSEKSNSMLSNNPNAGFPRVGISPTLDCTIPSPSKNQGGLVVVIKQNERNK